MKPSPPRRWAHASSLVVTAVLSLTLAGAAHALSVDIVLPETDPAEVYPQVRVRFLAVAWDEKGNEVTDRATFTWTFPDAKEPTVGNPVLHRFPEVGKFLVSVSATVNSDSGCDQTTVIVIPYEGGGGLRQAPGAGNFAFTANGHETGHEVSDDVTLLVEMVEDIGPWWWGVGEFQRYENGQWITPENQGWGEAYGWFTTLDDPHNGPVQWRARVMVDEIGADPPNGFDFYLLGTWTVVNTVVKSASPPLIFHHAEDTSHTIAWDLTHCEDFDPHFTMTVTIYDLGGATVATLVRYNVPLEEENPQIAWNTNLPEEDGIYAYRIHASHNYDPAPLYDCVDQDKSAWLTVSVNAFYYSSTDAPNGTLSGVVKYTLNGDAGSVDLEFYGPDFTGREALSGQPTDEGENWSAVYTIPGVQFDQNGAPIGPFYCVVFAEETPDDGADHRDGEPKPALPRGSTNLVRVLEILEPNENPVTDNNFVFDNTADPNGTCEVVATGTTHQGLDDDDLEWDLDEITGSTLSSDPDPPEGPEITFTYTRLPASNSEFGNHTLTLSHPDVPCKDYQTVQIFFPRDATNHPDPGTGATPNWYYYWDQTSATYGTHTYRGAAGTGQTVQQAGTFVSYIDAEACLYHPNGDILGWGPAEGIDYFAWICRHEAKHLADLSDWWPQGWHWWEDGDRTNPQVIPGVMGDWIPDILEPTILPGHPYDPNDGASQADAFNYGQDPLPDIEHYCLSTQAQWTNGSADSQDWAEPGHQSQR